MYDIYSSAQNDLWRFTLGKSGKRNLITIGLNPSTATKEKSDTTIAKVEKAARQAGFDGFVMLNLYPVRSSDFNALPLDVNAEAFERNLAEIEAVVVSQSKPVVWAAWGESILARKFFVAASKELFVRLEKHGTSWQQFGLLTQSGHPRHPSRLHYAWKFSPFDTKHYAKKFST
ncbi:MAG: DUF1643 domain-containing protein [Gallionella sp.]|nr:DUF1643 domain-containing protein [Gallionella sp.]MDD4947019.1 DUF1643 domain-containing protein [Gallionella sp.]MDD5613049.1 DUF1643 domain-containing protein [Gallionella sp.]